MLTIDLPAGETVPALGQGTWMMGEGGSRKSEAAALRVGIDLGMTLIDTAEMYASGGAEEVVADASAGQRDRLFIVSKVMPSNASHKGTIAACERSLKRLKTGRIDLYLLHWPSNHPIAGTVAAFEELRASGKIRHWGVSNFDVAEMEELLAVPGGTSCQVNQVLYNLTRRGIEHDLMPWSAKHRIPIMSYSPIEQGRLARNRAREAVAKKHGATPAQVALRFTLDQKTISIPKASSEPHVRETVAALDITLDDADRAALDAAFPPPGRKRPLEMI